MFDSLVTQHETKNTGKVTMSAYKKWQKLFSFDALRGKKYGESFCDYFDITDYRIKFDSNWDSCDRIIRSEWVVSA